MLGRDAHLVDWVGLAAVAQVTQAGHQGVSLWYVPTGLTMALLLLGGLRYAPVLLLTDPLSKLLASGPELGWGSTAARGALATRVYTAPAERRSEQRALADPLRLYFPRATRDSWCRSPEARATCWRASARRRPAVPRARRSRADRHPAVPGQQVRVMGDTRAGHTFLLVNSAGNIVWGADYGGAPDYTMYLPVNQRSAWDAASEADEDNLEHR